MSTRTYEKTCETCGEVYAAPSPNQRKCDDCWGAEMGAVRVEYRAKGGQNVRTAIVVCRKCAVEYPTRPWAEKHPGLCKRCSETNLDKTYSKVCDTCDVAFVALSPRTRMCDECWGAMMGAVRVERQRKKSGVLCRTAIVVCRECQREYSTGKEKRQNRDLCRSCMTYNKTCETCGEKWQAQGGKQRECDDCWAAAVGAMRVEYRANTHGANVRMAIMVGPEGGVVRVTEAKTSTGIRDVPIGQHLAAVLVAHRQATEGAEDAPVFADPQGEPYSRHGAPRYGLRRVAKAAGVEGVAWHTFRHTHATLLGTRPEVDAVTLAARLGHADPAFTARTYIHRDDDRARALADLADTLRLRDR